jgi:hypothetical protein
MAAIFLSYRRSDTAPFTGRVYDRLAARFGPDEVFKDADSIPKGADFRTVLAQRLGRCRVALVVIGGEWVTTAEPDGTRRLDNPNDFVRIEVETVLGRGIAVIPVLVGVPELPPEADLPRTLRPLRARQYKKFQHDGRFDADLSDLVRDVERALAGTAEAAPEPPPPAAGPAAARDRAWPEIARRVSDGARLVVLTGPAGVGKTFTAAAFARWHSPAAPVVRVDAGREFDELSLVEAVGAAYPDELYRGAGDQPGPLGAQRRAAIDLLVRHRAVVVLDGVGEAEYPRDPAAEVALGRRVAAELTAAGLLVVVTARDGAGWADHGPVALRGLAADGARELVRPAAEARPADWEGLIRRGNPGELLAAAEGRAAAGDRPRGRLGRAAGLARDALAAVIGDPIRPRPAERGSGPGALFLICVGLLLVAAVSSTWAYESGSARWERMFYGLARQPADVPPLGAGGDKVHPGPGELVELARASIVIFFFLLVVVGRFFAAEVAALVPRAPWARAGPRALGLRSLFRIVFVALAVWLGANTVAHHRDIGPRVLWMCNGNPFLQRHLEAADARAVRDLQGRPADDPDRMNGEPPAPGAAGYDEYRRECVVPYWRFFPYSMVMFAVVGPVVIIVCFYALCSSLWTHLIAQPGRVERVDDRAPAREVENRFRYYQGTYAGDVDKYLVMLLILLGCWAYHLWLDSRNLIASAADTTTRMLWVVLGGWAGMSAALVLAYQVLVREAGRKLPDGDARSEFGRRHGAVRFFARTVAGSSYAWLCLIPLAAIGAYQAVAAAGLLPR